MNFNNCLICGEALLYQEEASGFTCDYCRQVFVANISCPKGHFICDNCHSATASELIRTYCCAADLTDPLVMAITLMRSPQIKMHGPEHHFLVPAVLLTAYYNQKKDAAMKATKLAEAEKRAKNVLGGFCGFYGACGAGIGVGIFISLLAGATPLTTQSWGQSNLATSSALQAISVSGGPRCCKRDSFLAILSAVDFLRDNFAVELPVSEAIKCEFFASNNECLKKQCPFYPN